MDSIVRDLRHAFRRLRRSRAFTLIAVLSLALGIGANTAIFSLVQAVLLRGTAIQEDERVLELSMKSADFPYAPFSVPDLRDLVLATGNIFSSVGSAQFALMPRDLGDRIESVPAEMVNGRYFTTLGIKPHIGRLIGPEDDVSPGAHPVTVVSYDYWQTSFGGDPAAIGKTMRMNGREYTVIGVVQPEYGGALRGIPPAAYVPVMMINQLQPSSYDQLQSRGDHSTFVRARMKPGVTLAQVSTALAAFTSDMKSGYRNEWPQSTELRMTPLSEIVVNPMIDKFIVLAAGLLTVVVGMVLLIACANLASFLLAQARDRQREIAIRLALGAGRSGLVRQLLTESVVLALVGGVAGIALAKGLLSLLLNADLPLPIPVQVDATLNLAVLGFAFAISVIAGILFGLAPALQASRADVITTIKNENTGGGPVGKLALRNVLVVSQVAVCLVLLVLAGLLMRSLQARQNIDPGFGYKPAALVSFAVGSDRYTEEQARLLVQRFEDEVRRLPGISAVGATGNIHLNSLNTQNIGITVDGMQPPEGQDDFTVDHTRVTDGFLEAAGVPLVQGRGFNRAIDRVGTPRNVIINQAFAERFFPKLDPLGRTFRGDTTVYTIVGVAATAKIRSLGEDPRPFIYSSYSQAYTSLLTMVAQTTGSAERATTEVLSALRKIDPDVIVIETKTMQRHMAIMLLPARLGAVVFGGFAVLALVLAIIGVYGVVSYAVSRRTREVGIRMSLGAEPGMVVRLLMGHGLGLVAIGGTIGIAIALLASRVLQTLLYGVQSMDPVTFTAVPGLLLMVGALAAYLPARRASRVDPARVLKGD